MSILYHTSTAKQEQRTSKVIGTVLDTAKPKAGAGVPLERKRIGASSMYAYALKNSGEPSHLLTHSNGRCPLTHSPSACASCSANAVIAMRRERAHFLSKLAFARSVRIGYVSRNAAKQCPSRANLSSSLFGHSLVLRTTFSSKQSCPATTRSRPQPSRHPSASRSLSRGQG